MKFDKSEKKREKKENQMRAIHSNIHDNLWAKCDFGRN